MLEAVYSSLQNSALIQPVALQTSSSESLAANPDRVQKAASTGSAPFVSPFIFVDAANEQIVLQIRNSETGVAINQSASQDYVQPKQTTKSEVVFEAQQKIDAPPPAPTQTQTAQVQNTAIPAQQSAAFASASASGQQLESAGVSIFA